MNIEIHRPELARRVAERVQTGQFHDTDELIERALDALDEHCLSAPASGQTGAVILAALQASPYPEVDLNPPRVRLGNARDVTL